MTKAVWSGSLSIGLLQLQVKLYSAVERPVSLARICKTCGGQIGNVNRCKGCGAEPAFGDWNSGFKVSKSEYLTVAKEQVDALKLPTQESIPIIGFVKLEDLNPMWETGDKYYVGLEEKRVNIAARTAYALLLQVLKAKGYVGIGKLSMRGREAFIELKPYRNGLVISKLNYAEHIREEGEVFFETEAIEIDTETFELGTKLIESKLLKQPEDWYGEQKDEYIAQLMALLEGRSVTEVIAAAPVMPEQDLKALLAQSL